MHELKRLTPDAIPSAMTKAVRYRLLNEPEQAESICRDILQIDPANQDVLTTLILALSDRLMSSRPVPGEQIREFLPRLESEYAREYYAGIIDEREAIAWLRADKPRAGSTAHHFFHRAMQHYERAEALRPAGNDDAILRWNSCARMIAAHADVAPADDTEPVETQLGD